MAMLDRVVDGATIVKLKGKSYRAHRGPDRRKPTEPDTATAPASTSPGNSHWPLSNRETGPLLSRDQQKLTSQVLDFAVEAACQLIHGVEIEPQHETHSSRSGWSRQNSSVVLNNSVKSANGIDCGPACERA